MKICVGSKNDAKIEGVDNAFNKVFNDFYIEGISTDSGVRDTPLSIEETTQGAINRVNSLCESTDADYFVGLEGGVYRNVHGIFVFGSCAIFHKNVMGVGMSSFTLLPDSFYKPLFCDDVQLYSLASSLKSVDIDKTRQSSGINGILSNGVYDRVDEFTDSCTVALTKIVNTHYYGVNNG